MTATAPTTAETRLRREARAILVLRAQGLHEAADAATRRRDAFAREMYAAATGIDATAEKTLTPGHGA